MPFLAIFLYERDVFPLAEAWPARQSAQRLTSKQSPNIKSQDKTLVRNNL
jgi:hypothetical protein